MYVCVCETGCEGIVFVFICGDFNTLRENMQRGWHAVSRFMDLVFVCVVVVCSRLIED